MTLREAAKTRTEVERFDVFATSAAACRLLYHTARKANIYLSDQYCVSYQFLQVGRSLSCENCGGIHCNTSDTLFCCQSHCDGADEPHTTVHAQLSSNLIGVFTMCFQVTMHIMHIHEAIAHFNQNYFRIAINDIMSYIGTYCY